MLQDLLSPWTALTESEALPLNRELSKEVPRDHVLTGISCHALARGCDCDDILFATPGAPGGPFAIVHLTWSGKQDWDINFPWTTFYSSLEAWRQTCMIPDHEDFICEG